MKSKFLETYNSFMKNSIEVEDINKIYEFSKFILYEENFVLRCPKLLKETVEKVVLNLIKNNEFDKEVKINIKEALNDPLMNGFNDDKLYEDLLNLFKDKNEAFFKIKIDKICFDKKGEFIYPKEFIDGFDTDTLHFEYPRIKHLIINKNIEKSIESYKNDIKFIKNKYEQMQKALEIFKNNIINFNDFGTIVIYPENCTLDECNLDKPTLNETIEHECQHLCIFLLSLAKTYIWFGLHFSNNITKTAFKYELKESEFITLFGSYCNILLRIYKSIKGEKNPEDFIKTLIDLCICEKTNKDEKYVNALESSLQFSRIKDFYRSIYEDSKSKLNERFYENGKINKRIVGIFVNENKFNKLIKWTIRNFKENLNKINK